MSSRESANANFIVFGVTRSALENPRGEHANHHTTSILYIELLNEIIWGRRGPDCMLDLQLPIQSVPTTTKVVSSNPV